MRSVLGFGLIILGLVAASKPALAAPSPSAELAPVEFYFYINTDNDIMGIRDDGSVDHQGEIIFDQLNALLASPEAEKIANFGVHFYMDRGTAMNAGAPTSSETLDSCSGQAPKSMQLGETNSADSSNLTALLAQECYPVAKRFVVIWSHGDGFRVQHDFDYTPDVKDFHISQLLSAIPDGFAEAVIFDSCFMASVEVASLLKGKSNWMVASQFELPNAGIQYTGLATVLSSSRDTVSILGQLRTDSEKKFDEINIQAPLVLIDLSRFEDLRAAFVTAWGNAASAIAGDFQNFRSSVLRGDRDGDLFFLFSRYSPQSLPSLTAALESGRGSLSFALPVAAGVTDADMESVARFVPTIFQAWSTQFPNWGSYAKVRPSPKSSTIQESKLGAVI